MYAANEAVSSVLAVYRSGLTKFGNKYINPKVQSNYYILKICLCLTSFSAMSSYFTLNLSMLTLS